MLRISPFCLPLQIPFYPVVKKDLTFIHLGNDTKVEGLINFEKLRMIAKEVRTLTNMCSSPYDLLTMLELGNLLPFLANFQRKSYLKLPIAGIIVIYLTPDDDIVETHAFHTHVHPLFLILSNMLLK